MANKISSFDKNNATNNETILVSPATSVFHVNMSENKMYYRDPADGTAIKRINYDATGDELFYQHNETIRWIVWCEINPAYIYFSTETGLYAVKISDGSIAQLINSPDITNFDFHYVPA